MPQKSTKNSPGILLILCLLCLFAAASAQGQKNDITYSTSVVTPHIPWATKLPQGPIKGFFIPSIQYGRDMVELMQRLSLDPTTDSIDSSWDINCWGIGDYYGHEYRGDRDDFRTVYGYVEKDLTGNARYEVMLIPGINGWSRLTRATRDAILRRVQDGAGLVLLHPFVGDVAGHPFKGDEPAGDERIWEISPLIGVANDTVNERGYPEVNRDAVTKGKWELGDPHFITEGLPLELLPEGTVGGSFYRYKSRGDVLIKSGAHPIMSVSNYGKGRVVAMAYLEEGFTPQSINPIENKIYWDYWEYQYSLLARAVLWAAGRNTSVRIQSLIANEDGLKLSLNASSQQSVKIEVNGHNEFGGALSSTTVEKVLASGSSTIEIPAARLRPSFGWSGGRQIVNVIIRDAKDNATLNWGAATFTTPKRGMMTSVKTAVDVYKRGETLSAVLRASGNLNGLQMRMQVWDDLGRLLGSVSAPARGERTFTFPLTDFLGKFALVRGELIDGNTIVDQIRAKPAMVVQDTRREKEYTALVSFGGTKHYLQDAQMKMVRAAAADTGFTWSNDVDNSLNIPRGTFGVYWYDRGPTTPEAMERAIAEYQKTGDFEALGYLTKKELYKRTGDKKFLQRTPSFNDPAVLKNLADIVRASARNKARYNMDYYFVGDEGSLTSYGDAVDFDWNPHTLAEFRVWLQQQYGSLSALNNEWRTSFSDWNSVVPYTTEEARKTRNFAPWADHRTFMEITFARAYQTARDAAIEGDPDAHIAVSGTQATNAYNGADWSRLDRVIDDFLSYDGGNQWDMHRSFAKPNAMIGFWTGYGSHGLAVQNAIWTAAIHNVLHPNIFWMYSFLNPDLTHSASARDMGKAFSSLRSEGVGKLLMESVRQQDGIALYYSMPSIHAASILGYHQRSSDDDDEVADKARLSFSANRDGWVKTIKDLGLQFDFVSSEDVAAHGIANDKYKVVILPLVFALSNEEIQQLEQFVTRGGVVIADAAPGWLDQHCAWQQNAGVNKLFGIAAVDSDKRQLKLASGDVRTSPRGGEWNLPGPLSDIRIAEPDVKASGGTALLKIDNNDAAIVNRTGAGWTIYLNTAWDQYPKQRASNFAGAAYRRLFSAILTKAGVQPSIQVSSLDGRQLQQAQIARYKFGNAEIIAIVKENVALAGVVGQDGVTTYNDANLGQVAKQELTIKLPRKFYVADVRTGKSMGFTDVVRSSVLIGDALVLALTPEGTELNVSGPDSAQTGQHVSFRLRTTAPGTSLVRCHVYAPDGTLLPIYSNNILVENGRGTFTLPFALNDRTGKYVVRVTNVVTGAMIEMSIDLK
jgi:hypothetical protein